MSELTDIYDRLHPPATLSRAELLLRLDAIQAQIQALIEPAYLAGLVGPESRLQLTSAAYNVRTLQCWLRRDAAEEASLESKLEASIEMVRSKNNCRQVGETE